jgi:ABC-2 type transport system ATP-binding protein
MNAQSSVESVPAVVVDGLTVRYGEVTAVDGLSFAAAAGAVTAILGPNGAGKTTTVEALEGFRRPTGGRAQVLGLDPVDDRPRLVPRIGVMLQDGGIHPGLRPLEVLRHGAALYPQPLDPVRALDQVGLGGRERRTWRQLSGGEQRRLALALALIGRPEVVFLDEPTAGVDPQGRIVIREVVRRLRDEGTTVVLTTHDLDEAERVADHVLIVDRGRLVADGTPAELMRQGSGGEIRFGGPPAIDVADLSGRLGGVEVQEAAPGEYVVAAPPSPATVAALTAWLAERDLPLADLRAGRQRLEDVFLRLTSEPDAATPRRRRRGAGRRQRRHGGGRS